MKAIVMNTLNGAVTEYDWPITSIGPTRAGSAAGLHSLGGNTDAGMPIAASITTGRKLWGDTIKKFVAYIYFAMTAAGMGRARVETRSQTYAYEFPVQAVRLVVGWHEGAHVAHPTRPSRSRPGSSWSTKRCCPSARGRRCCTARNSAPWCCSSNA